MRPEGSPLFYLIGVAFFGIQVVIMWRFVRRNTSASFSRAFAGLVAFLVLFVVGFVVSLVLSVLKLVKGM